MSSDINSDHIKSCEVFYCLLVEEYLHSAIIIEVTLRHLHLKPHIQSSVTALYLVRGLAENDS